MSTETVISMHCDRCQSGRFFPLDQAESRAEARELMTREGWHCGIQGPEPYHDAKFDKDYCRRCYPFIEAGIIHLDRCSCHECQEVRKKMKQ